MIIPPNRDDLLNLLSSAISKILISGRASVRPPSHSPVNHAIALCEKLFLDRRVEICIERTAHCPAHKAEFSMTSEDVTAGEASSRRQLTEQIATLQTGDELRRRIRSSRTRRTESHSLTAEGLERSLRDSLARRNAYLDAGFEEVCESCSAKQSRKHPTEPSAGVPQAVQGDGREPEKSDCEAPQRELGDEPGLRAGKGARDEPLTHRADENEHKKNERSPRALRRMQHVQSLNEMTPVAPFRGFAASAAPEKNCPNGERTNEQGGQQASKTRRSCLDFGVDESNKDDVAPGQGEGQDFKTGKMSRLPVCGPQNSRLQQGTCRNLGDGDENDPELTSPRQTEDADGEVFRRLQRHSNGQDRVVRDENAVDYVFSDSEDLYRDWVAGKSDEISEDLNSLLSRLESQFADDHRPSQSRQQEKVVLDQTDDLRTDQSSDLSSSLSFGDPDLESLKRHRVHCENAQAFYDGNETNVETDEDFADDHHETVGGDRDVQDLGQDQPDWSEDGERAPGRFLRDLDTGGDTGDQNKLVCVDGGRRSKRCLRLLHVNPMVHSRSSESSVSEYEATPDEKDHELDLGNTGHQDLGQDDNIIGLLDGGRRSKRYLRFLHDSPMVQSGSSEFNAREYEASPDERDHELDLRDTGHQDLGQDDKGLLGGGRRSKRCLRLLHDSPMVHSRSSESSVSECEATPDERDYELDLGNTGHEDLGQDDNIIGLLDGGRRSKRLRLLHDSPVTHAGSSESSVNEYEVTPDERDHELDLGHKGHQDLGQDDKGLLDGGRRGKRCLRLLHDSPVTHAGSSEFSASEYEASPDEGGHELDLGNTGSQDLGHDEIGLLDGGRRSKRCLRLLHENHIALSGISDSSGSGYEETPDLTRKSLSGRDGSGTRESTSVSHMEVFSHAFDDDVFLLSREVHPLASSSVPSLPIEEASTCPGFIPLDSARHGQPIAVESKRGQGSAEQDHSLPEEEKQNSKTHGNEGREPTTVNDSSYTAPPTSKCVHPVFVTAAKQKAFSCFATSATSVDDLNQPRALDGKGKQEQLPEKADEIDGESTERGENDQTVGTEIVAASQAETTENRGRPVEDEGKRHQLKNKVPTWDVSTTEAGVTAKASCATAQMTNAGENIPTTENSEAEDSTQASQNDQAVKTIDEDGMPTTMDEDTMPTTVDEDAMPTIIDEDAMPTTIDEDAMQTAINEDGMPTTIDEDAIPTISPQGAVDATDTREITQMGEKDEGVERTKRAEETFTTSTPQTKDDRTSTTTRPEAAGFSREAPQDSQEAETRKTARESLVVKPASPKQEDVQDVNVEDTHALTEGSTPSVGASVDRDHTSAAEETDPGKSQATPGDYNAGMSKAAKRSTNTHDTYAEPAPLTAATPQATDSSETTVHATPSAAAHDVTERVELGYETAARAQAPDTDETTGGQRGVSRVQDPDVPETKQDGEVVVLAARGHHPHAPRLPAENACPPLNLEAISEEILKELLNVKQDEARDITRYLASDDDNAVAAAAAAAAVAGDYDDDDDDGAEESFTVVVEIGNDTLEDIFLAVEEEEDRNDLAAVWGDAVLELSDPPAFHPLVVVEKTHQQDAAPEQIPLDDLPDDSERFEFEKTTPHGHQEPRPQKGVGLSGNNYGPTVGDDTAPDSLAHEDEARGGLSDGSDQEHVDDRRSRPELPEVRESTGRRSLTHRIQPVEGCLQQPKALDESMTAFPGNDSCETESLCKAAENAGLTGNELSGKDTTHAHAEYVTETAADGEANVVGELLIGVVSKRVIHVQVTGNNEGTTQRAEFPETEENPGLTGNGMSVENTTPAHTDDATAGAAAGDVNVIQDLNLRIMPTIPARVLHVEIVAQNNDSLHKRDMRETANSYREASSEKDLHELRHSRATLRQPGPPQTVDHSEQRDEITESANASTACAVSVKPQEADSLKSKPGEETETLRDVSSIPLRTSKLSKLEKEEGGKSKTDTTQPSPSPAGEQKEVDGMAAMEEMTGMDAVKEMKKAKHSGKHRDGINENTRLPVFRQQNQPTADTQKRKSERLTRTSSVKDMQQRFESLSVAKQPGNADERSSIPKPQRKGSFTSEKTEDSAEVTSENSAEQTQPSRKKRSRKDTNCNRGAPSSLGTKNSKKPTDDEDDILPSACPHVQIDVTVPLDQSQKSAQTAESLRRQSNRSLKKRRKRSSAEETQGEKHMDVSERRDRKSKLPDKSESQEGKSCGPSNTRATTDTGTYMPQKKHHHILKDRRDCDSSEEIEHSSPQPKTHNTKSPFSLSKKKNRKKKTTAKSHSSDDNTGYSAASDSTSWTISVDGGDSRDEEKFHGRKHKTVASSSPLQKLKRALRNDGKKRREELGSPNAGRKGKAGGPGHEPTAVEHDGTSEEKTDMTLSEKLHTTPTRPNEGTKAESPNSWRHRILVCVRSEERKRSENEFLSFLDLAAEGTPHSGVSSTQEELLGPPVKLFERFSCRNDHSRVWEWKSSSHSNGKLPSVRPEKAPCLREERDYKTQSELTLQPKDDGVHRQREDFPKTVGHESRTPEEESSSFQDKLETQGQEYCRSEEETNSEDNSKTSSKRRSRIENVFRAENEDEDKVSYGGFEPEDEGKDEKIADRAKPSGESSGTVVTESLKSKRSLFVRVFGSSQDKVKK